MQRPANPLDVLRTLVDGGLMLAALGVLLIVAAKAAMVIDSGHDAWWYHLPFAARLAGLSPAEDYRFDDFLEPLFAGFPVLIEWLQGLLWRLTGRAEATNFVAFGSLLLFVAFLRLRFRVPLHLTLLCLMAVPLIQIHVAFAHVDLPANLALATAILLLIPLYARDNAQRSTDAMLFALACAVTAHSKLQLIPMTALVLAAGGVALLLAWRRAGRRASGGRLFAGTLALVAVAAAIFYVPLKNTVRYGNPMYPFALKAGPIEVPGPLGIVVSHTDRLLALYASRTRALAPPGPGRLAEAAQAKGAGTLDQPAGATLADPTMRPTVRPLPVAPDPVAWVRSVLEVGMEPVLGHGQWQVLGAQRPPLPGRYGGFFGWYVGFHLILFAVLIGTRWREHAGILVLFLAVTLVAALAPSQSILRYYMFWMIVLICLNLILLSPMRQPHPVKAHADLRRLVGLVGLGAFLLVVYATRAAYVQPRLYRLEDLIAVRRDPLIQAEVASHRASCLAGEIVSRMFLYAPLFNPGKAYRLKLGPMAGDPWEHVADACGPGWTPVIVVRVDAGLLPPGYPRDRASMPDREGERRERASAPQPTP